MSELYIPRDFSTTAIKFAAARNYAALFLDPGLGKTGIMLAIFKILRKYQGRKRMLVVAPKPVMLTSWPDEVAKWTQFNDYTVSIITGTRKQRLRALAVDADIYLINPENIAWLASIGFRQGWCDVLCVDESTKFKGATNKRMQAIAKFLITFRNRYILTGTPIPRGLHDIWAQIFLLDGGQHLGKNVTAFRNRFFNAQIKGNYVDYVAAPWAEEQVQELIKPFTISMKAEDHIDMPELVEYDVEVDLPRKLIPLYSQLEDELFVAMDHGDIHAANAGVLTQKLHQIAQGAIYESDDPLEPKSEAEKGKPKKWNLLHDAKLDRLDLLLDELQGQPVIVAYNFKHDAERLTAFLNKRFKKEGKYLHLGAGAKDSLFQTAKNEWNARRLDVLLVQTSIVAHGLNIQFGGNHIIMFCNTYNFEHYDQLRRRLYRPGQRSDTVMIHRLVTRGTVDRAVVGRLRHREDDQESFVAALNEYRNERLMLAA